MPKTDYKLSLNLKKLTKSRGLVLGLVILVIVLGVFVASRIYSSQHKKSGRNTVSVADKLDMQVRKDAVKGDYSASTKALESAPQTEEYELLRITLYRNKGDNQAALAVYERLLAKKTNDLGLVLGAAETAVAAGNKQKAIQYYEQAKKIESKTESPVKAANMASYDLKIKELGGQ